MAQALLVVSNPYCALDIDGEPCGYVDRTDVPGGRMIGGTVDHVRSVSASGATADEVSAAPHAPKFVWRKDPEAIADTPAHRALLRTGEILPADEATAALAGVRWLPVADALAVERGKAAAAFLAARGTESPFLGAPSAPPTPEPSLAPKSTKPTTAPSAAA